MGTFFTSDQHFDHAGIIGHCARPFRSVGEMNAYIMSRHNATVSDDDTVYHLGDFSWHENRVVDYLRRLRGHHVLIAGNHDRCHPMHSRHERERRRYLEAGFVEIHERLMLDLPFGRVMLCHFPLLENTDADVRHIEWRPRELDADWLLCGHVHEKWKRMGRCINVGVDQFDFQPVSLERIGEVLG